MFDNNDLSSDSSSDSDMDFIVPAGKDLGPTAFSSKIQIGRVRPDKKTSPSPRDSAEAARQQDIARIVGEAEVSSCNEGIDDTENKSGSAGVGSMDREEAAAIPQGMQAAFAPQESAQSSRPRPPRDASHSS